MSFAVVRMAKMKSHDLKGIQFHNQRERESKTNPDIDKTRSDLNYDLINSIHIDYNKKVKEIIDSQKISTRKTRKDAVLVNELLITSSKDFFDELSPEDEKRFFEESYKLFSERYGKQNIAYATVHKDEKTPHLHLGVVPMREGRLQGRNVFNRKELLWIQEEFPKHMQSLGFEIERGEKGSKREHIETQVLKANTLDQQVKELEDSREILQKDVEGLLKAVEDSKGLDEIQVDKGGLFDRRNVKLSVEDFESIKTLASSSEALKTQIKGFKVQLSSLEKENKDLKRENRVIENENKKLRKERNKLKKETDRLDKMVEALRKTIEYFKQAIEFIKEESFQINIAKERMAFYVGFMRMKSASEKYGEHVIDHVEEIVPEDEEVGGFHFVERKKERLKEIEKEQEEEKLKLQHENQSEVSSKKIQKDDFEMER